MIKNKSTYTISEASRVAEVTPRTIQRWIYAGKLKAKRMPEFEGMYEIEKQELAKAIKGSQPDRVLEKIYAGTRIYRDSEQCTLLVFAKKREGQQETVYVKAIDDLDLNLEEFGINLKSGLEPTKKEKKLLQDIERLINSHRKGGEK